MDIKYSNDLFLENNKFERIEDFKMRLSIFKSRKNKVVDMKQKIEELKSEIDFFEMRIKDIRAEIVEKTEEYNMALDDINKTDVKSIKLL